VDGRNVSVVMFVLEGITKRREKKEKESEARNYNRRWKGRGVQNKKNIWVLRSPTITRTSSA